MKIQTALVTALAALLLAAAPASYAAAGTLHSPVLAMFAKGEKKVKFNIRNETGSPLELKIGDQVSTLQSNQVMPLKLPVGTRVIANTDAGRYHAGDVLVTVTAEMYSDSTIAIGK